MAGALTPSMRLPALRANLAFTRQDQAQTEEPVWLLHDPLQHRFFRISEDTRRLLELWQPGVTPEELAEAARTRLGFETGPVAIQQLLVFLDGANLLEGDAGRTGQKREAGRKARRRFDRRFAELLFPRFPLLDPQPLLNLLAPVTAILFTRAFAIALALAAILGTWLSFTSLANRLAEFHQIGLPGFVQFALAVIFVKSCHELGHGIAAHRFGCRVPTMGVALIAGLPLLYTDVTEAWKLASRSRRALVGAAGLLAELLVAILATLLYAFLEDGLLRDMMFHLAAVGWISSLFFNLNPLTRFDGYYIMCDLIGVENLHQRSAAAARDRLRHRLLALPLPAIHAGRRGMALAAFGVLAYLYRLIVMIGLSLIIYGYLTQVVGIVMLGLTLAVFVAWPVLQELLAWRKLGAESGIRPRFRRPLIATLALLIMLFAPLHARVDIPAVLVAAEVQRVFPPRNARILEAGLRLGETVHPEQVLVRFDIPELESEAARVAIELEAARQRLRRALSSQSEPNEITVLRQNLASLVERKSGLEAEQQALSVVSRFEGEIVELSREFVPGNWIARSRSLAVLRSRQGVVAHGYVAEADLLRIRAGAAGRFIPEDPSRPAIDIVLQQISADTARSLDFPELAAIHGGSIAVRPGPENALEPLAPVFQARFAVAGQTAMPNQSVRGTIILSASRQSLASLAWRRIARVIVREAAL